ncbi:MAG: DHHA1 domain-containing protein [bacterium]
MKNGIICFYHGNCVDGAAAAAVIKHKYPEAHCYPLQHGDPIPVSVNGKTLFIVDFSFDEDTLKKLKEEAKEVFWYDHHKTVLPVYESLKWGVIDLNESGATLTWKEEFPGTPTPEILKYVKDKDIWEWKLPHSREINMALREREDIHDPAGETWKKMIAGLSESEFKRLVDLGDAVIKSQQLRIKNGARFGFEVDFHGHRTLAVNWSLESSEMGEHIYKDLDYEIALIFHYTGKHWNFSLRSNKVDVSRLASQHGGGGHAGAAGFRSDSIEWLIQLKK